MCIRDSAGADADLQKEFQACEGNGAVAPHRPLLRADVGEDVVNFLFLIIFEIPFIEPQQPAEDIKRRVAQKSPVTRIAVVPPVSYTHLIKR